jgi:hypothetical protein
LFIEKRIDADVKNEQNKLAQFAGGPNRKLKADENDIFGEIHKTIYSGA